MRYSAELDHRRSTRLPTWDYRDTGAYFVTICTHDREPLFGRFVTDELVLNPFGEIVKDVWGAIPDHFATIGLDAFVVMPNHVHGIIWIQREPSVIPITTVGARHASPLRHDDAKRLANRRTGVPAGSLAVIVGSFKSAAAKRVNTLRGTPGAPSGNVTTMTA